MSHIEKPSSLDEFITVYDNGMITFPTLGKASLVILYVGKVQHIETSPSHIHIVTSEKHFTINPVDFQGSILDKDGFFNVEKASAQMLDIYSDAVEYAKG